MENQSNSWTKEAMNFGLYMGLALVLNSALFYVMGKPFSEGTLTLVILVGFIVWGIWSLRNANGNKGLSYESALGFGTMISLFASFIVAFYTYILYKIIDPGLLGKFIIFLEENLLKAGWSENRVEMMINFYNRHLTPLSYSIIQIFTLTFMGFVSSLIISIFFRKQPSDPFQGVE
jgi:hypothetical protein